MNIKPLADRVVLKSVEAEEKTKTGILLTASAQEVVAIGPGARDEKGELIPMEVAVGDKVIAAKYAGTEVKFDGVEYTIVKQGDILAVVK